MNSAVRSILLELAGDQITDRIERGIRIGAIGTDRNHGTVAGSEHHETHDAFAIHFLAILLNENVRLETIGRFDELRGRAGVDAELVEDGEIFFGHGCRLAPRGT